MVALAVHGVDGLWFRSGVSECVMHQKASLALCTSLFVHIWIHTNNLDVHILVVIKYIE